MNLLILGGTKFVGRHITAACLMRGHHVTLFNRGRTNADLFPDAERLNGDRDGGLDVLQDRTWDAVIDVNGYFPRIVTASAQLLANAADRYVYISTLSVYADFSTFGQTEDAPLAQLADPTTEVIDGATYGGLKSLCEQAVTAAFPERALIPRLGYVVGPYDPLDRWTSWLRHISRGGEMLAPGSPEAPIQFIDARDVAAFVVDMVERRALGIYNTTGFNAPLTWGEAFEKTRLVTGADTTLVWVNEDFLKTQSLQEGDLPMFAFAEDAGVFGFNNHKAISAGLHFRAIGETITDTLLWDVSGGTRRSGLKPERERELLSGWRKFQST